MEESLITDPATGEIVKTKSIPIMCVNCYKAGHVASDKKCQGDWYFWKKLKIKRDNDNFVVTQPTGFVKTSKVASND